MQIVKIKPGFQSSEERNLIAIAIGLTLVFGGYLSFVPPLILYFGFPDKLSASGKLILRQFINFMINIAIIMVVLTVSIIGLPLAPVVFVVAVIYTIINVLSVLNNSETNIPIIFEALKESSEINSSKAEEDKE